MKVNVLTRKLIKACTPTPESRRFYHLSLHDELSTPMDAAVVLYYQSAASHMEGKGFDTIFPRLEESLSKILPHFYPLAGRYIKNKRLVDCSDQGVEFILAKASADLKLLDVVDVQDPPNELLPRGPIVVEDDTGSYPLLSIQATGFSCGGMTIGVSVSHRVVDTSSLATFIAFWANESYPNGLRATSFPTFDTPTMFPGRNPHVSVDIIPQTMEGFASKRFKFNKEAIMALKEKISDARAASKVRVVCAALAKALIRADQVKHASQSRAYIIGHSLNLRGRIRNPPLPENACGNLAASALVPLIAAKDAKTLGLEDLVYLQRDAIHKAMAEYTETLARGEAGHDIFIDELVYLNETTATGDVPVLWFSDMTKFGFYEADFGWGNPIWMSFGTCPLENLVVLLPDKAGSGIEAWVHLDPESMALFEQDVELSAVVPKNVFLISKV